MTTELVRANTGEVVVAGDGIDDWVQMLGSVGELASKISQTPFVPDSLRGSTAGVAAAILTGRELGVPPMLALRHVHVIKGKPGLSAELMRMLVLRAGHEIEVLEATDTRCKVRGRRRGQEQWQETAFTADQARRAKIDLGAYPEDKLVARATTRLCRRMFADTIGGMPTVDELEDGVDQAASETSGPAAVPPPSPARRTAQRRTRGVTAVTRQEAAEAPRAEAPEPELDDDVQDAEPVDEPETPAGEQDPDEPPPDEDTDGDHPDPNGPLSEAQSKALHAALNGIGWKGDRAAKLDLLGVMVGREVGSSTELTRREMGGVLDFLGWIGKQGDPLAALRAHYTEQRKKQRGES